ncbi:MAG: hypothetical protein FWH19_00215 [Treponema sp.]|nr:hypothetical protein [Treponema sp.]
MRITTGKIFALLLALALFAMMAACFSPWEGDEPEMGTVIISLGGGAGRFTYPPDTTMQADLIHVISFNSTAGNHDDITITGLPFSQSVHLAPGSWTISVVAYENQTALITPEPYANGEVTVNVVANTNTRAPIQMYPVFTGPDPVWVTSGNTTTGYASLDDALDAIDLAGPGDYTVWLTNDQTIAGGPLAEYSIPAGTSITLRAQSEVRISRSTGKLFTMTDSNATLILTDNIILTRPGGFPGDDSLIGVLGGKFIMQGGKITGNAPPNTSGGGVFVSVGGTFTMSGGEIFGNTVGTATNGQNGGGVYVNSGTFTMTGGAIFDNTASNYGGGVFVNKRLGGVFIKEDGGTIYGENASVGVRNWADGDSTPQPGGAASDNLNLSPPGHAVCAAAATYTNPSSMSNYIEFWNRNVSAEENTDMDSDVSGPGGGWQ